MNLDLLFKIFNNAVIPFWLLMAFAPRWWLTQWLLRVPIAPLLLAAAYTTFVIIGFFSGADADPKGDFFSLDGIVALFARKEVALIGWIHYLAFDLWVGMWELRDSQKHQISHLLVVPCLFLTLMFGPAGFLLYWLIKKMKNEKH